MKSLFKISAALLIIASGTCNATETWSEEFKIESYNLSGNSNEIYFYPIRTDGTDDNPQSCSNDDIFVTDSTLSSDMVNTFMQIISFGHAEGTVMTAKTFGCSGPFNKINGFRVLEAPVYKMDILTMIFAIAITLAFTQGFHSGRTR